MKKNTNDVAASPMPPSASGMCSRPNGSSNPTAINAAPAKFRTNRSDHGHDIEVHAEVLLEMDCADGEHGEHGERAENAQRGAGTRAAAYIVEDRLVGHRPADVPPRAPAPTRYQPSPNCSMSSPFVVPGVLAPSELGMAPPHPAAISTSVAAFRTTASTPYRIYAEKRRKRRSTSSGIASSRSVITRIRNSRKCSASTPSASASVFTTSFDGTGRLPWTRWLR